VRVAEYAVPMLLAYWLLGVPLGACLAFGRGFGAADNALPAGDGPA